MALSEAARIPRRAYVVWLGEELTWPRVLAVRSAALRGGFDEVVLHHDADLSRTPHYRELVETPRVRLERLDMDALLERCTPHVEGLRAVHARLRTPGMRSDLVRIALLYTQGGVYIDSDTVTLRSFEPLCRGVSAFCGEERIVYTAAVHESPSPAVFLQSRARAVLRDVLRRVPRGYRLFRKVEHFYPKAVNNAIVASVARGAFLEQLLSNMFALGPRAYDPVYVIGPHLWQKTVAAYRGDDLAVHPPAVFFPIGPEISEHWFRKVKHADLGEVLWPETYLVHWYASVRTRHLLPAIDPDYVRRNAQTQLFSALALPFV